MELLQQIRHWIEERLQEPAYAPYFVIEVRLAGTRKVEVFLDGDQGIDLDTCRDFSRYLENLLDAGGQLGEDYTLEVSSPGATRPLALPRQYPKHVGRTLEVRRTDGSRLEGRLTEAGTETMTLEVTTGKGRKKEISLIPIPFEEIAECRVKISFKA
jgi:ribosome maturation factor RimP